MKLLLSYLKAHKKIVVLTLLLAAVNQLFSLLDPLIFRYTIDNVILATPRLTADVFLWKVLLFLGLAVGAAFMSRTAKNFQDYFVNYIVQKVGAAIYSDGLRHSLQLSYQDFEDQRSGETLGILQKARTDAERVIGASVNILFTTFVGIIFVVFYAFSVHWIIVVLYFVGVASIGVVSNILSKRIKKMQKVIVAETTALSGSTTESLRNIELVKSLGLADQEINRLNSVTEKILGLELKKVRFVRSLSFIQGTIVNFMRTAILFVMLYLVYDGTITIGAMFSLFVYSFFLFGPLQELGAIISIYREAEASLDNLKKIFDTPVERKPAAPRSIDRVKTIELCDVSFKHRSASAPALEGITVNVQTKETVAFVGPSGSGKTTLVKLLVGLYTQQEGKLLYNGIDSKELDFDAVRQLIGFVTQETQLFAGTIRDNLLFVNPTATDEQCLDVLKKAACDSLLARADKGLDSVIGEGGVKVSGGERQRLSIARALLRQPDVLIFDEATSALDSITEEEITSTIRDISERKDHITVMIAHRLSTIMHADRIYVLEKGRIIETGTHATLLDEKGLYYAMWRQQIGEAR
ncbi:MAG: ABC transporter ATP-binding protein [Ignavibacteria bacterium]|nr:ABC transporter ATP-binding protein [Ignavibacteria bacterium]MBK6418858.1 ABC transporter ATP-binding protein [Ignavibacteria bacterium]MBK7411764.1 ABC transporter ATP-binding protein [Ignavibacteria bacterium]MBL0323100.1 ABC transporter ATP-binding protein [Ignavibacteria bacterium]MBP7093031.1 ABC transporter ATP-binding protein [Candidatus Kapabacteria bacterium]